MTDADSLAIHQPSLWAALDAIDADPTVWLDTPSEAAAFEADVRADVDERLGPAALTTVEPVPAAQVVSDDIIAIVDYGVSRSPARSAAQVSAATPAQPRLRLTAHPTPDVPTPSLRRPLPPPLVSATTFRRTRSVDTPAHVATPTQTPVAAAGTSEARGRRDHAGTPTPLGAALSARKPYQTLSSHFELFNKTVDKSGDTRAKGKGKGKGKEADTVLGLGGTVLQGLRVCMAAEKHHVNKHKHRWEIITKLGAVVVLQPDTAITHVIYDGRSQIGLARELGLEGLYELPEGTICVKWDWVVQCKLASSLTCKGKVLDPTAWLSFPRNPFSRAVSAQVLPSRFADITDQLKGPSFRKREHTASDSETESPDRPRAAPGAARRSGHAFGQVGQSDHAIDARPRRGPAPAPGMPDVAPADYVATRHEPAEELGWLPAVEGQGDALDEMISGLKNGSIQAEESDDEGNPNPRADHFKCGQAHDGQGDGGPNEWLAKKFDDLHDMYQGVQGKSDFATRGYQKTANILRRTPYPIKSGAQARAIKGIGTSMADRIDEFLTGGPGRAYYEDTEQARVVALFKDIYGIGKIFANELYRRGARTINDLRNNDYGLTPGQLIGVALYDDLISRIPRAECCLIYKRIKAAALAVDPKLVVEIMGSYRRGQENSGDVDILITRDDSDGLAHYGALRRIVDALKAEGLITHDLSMPHDWDALEAKWMGVGRLGTGRHRRIDLLTVPFASWGAALLYFTGNDTFNRSLRLYARKSGYTLNQRGLYGAVHRDAKGNKLTEGTLVASRTEQEIFDVLGVRWREPHHRRP